MGLGAIGVLVANAAIELGMEVYGYDPFISVSAAWGLSSRAIRCESLDQMLGSCDYVTLHVPLNDETRNLINGERLKRCKKRIANPEFLPGRPGGVVSRSKRTEFGFDCAIRYRFPCSRTAWSQRRDVDSPSWSVHFGSRG